MSKLDEILKSLEYTVMNSNVTPEQFQSQIWFKITDKTKTDIKALFLELIGEDQTYKSGTRDSDVTKNGRIRSRNDYKAELRKKVGEL